MVIRDATRDDVPRIAEIYNEAVLRTTATADDKPRSVADRLAWFDARRGSGLPVLVAEESDSEPVIGWASLSAFHSRIGYRYTAENSIYVAEPHQNRGAGRALLAELVARAEQLGLHAIVAVIAGGNEASVRLHGAFGFQECGRLPELMWKFGAWVDVVYMVKLLA